MRTMICTFEAAMGLHPLWLYLFQKIGARNIGEIETISHAVQFVQLDQHQVDIGLHNRRDLHHRVCPKFCVNAEMRCK